MRPSSQILRTTANAPARGLGLTEYLIVVALLAIAVLGSVKLFGWRVEEQYFGGTIEVETIGSDGPSGGAPTPRGSLSH